LLLSIKADLFALQTDAQRLNITHSGGVYPARLPITFSIVIQISGQMLPTLRGQIPIRAPALSPCCW